MPEETKEKQAILSFDDKKYDINSLEDETKKVLTGLRVSDAQIKFYEDTLRVLVTGRTSLVNDLKAKQAGEAQKFEREFEKSTNKIQGALIDVLSMIANKNKLDVVMAKNQLLLVGKDIDLTEDAIKELNRILPKITKD